MTLACFRILTIISNIFILAATAVLESVGTHKVSIIRHGNLDEVVKVR